MKKEFSGAQKLEVVLHHHILLAGGSPFRNVAALKDHYGVSGENLRQWRHTLLDGAEEIFTDKRQFRERVSYEAEIKRLKARIDQLEKETSWSDPDEFE